MEKKREIWVDDIKVIACVLVAVGHFFMSMNESNIISGGSLYEWFIQTIYYFHVPLFFICSGYLYQKSSKVRSLSEWKQNVLKKLLILGVPYFVFTFATWILKTIFAGSVNTAMDGLFSTLFVRPTAPYWYLYALFFVFVITPTMKNKKMAIIFLVISLAIKIISVGGVDFGAYAINIVLKNHIWFVMGMCLEVIEFTKKKEKMKPLLAGSVIGIAFVLGSIIFYNPNSEYKPISFMLGVMACISIVLIVEGLVFGEEQNKVMGIMSKYTMPIFLMHTIFAAALRSVLFKLGIHNGFVHIALGLTISFIGPIVAAKIMERIKLLDFLIYPGKYIRFNEEKTKS